MQPLTRKQLYQRLAMGKNALIKQGVLDELGYRALLAKHGAHKHAGRVSATTMTTVGLAHAYCIIEQMGYKYQRTKQTAPKGYKRLNGSKVRKIWALWFTLRKDGVIHNVSADALNAWLARQGCPVNIDELGLRGYRQHADVAIEALKAWHKRAYATKSI